MNNIWNFIKNKWNEPRTVILLLLSIIIFSAGSFMIYYSTICSIPHPTISRILLAAGLVITTSLSYKIFYDICVKNSEQKTLQEFLRKILTEHMIGNRVNVIFEQKDLLDIFQKRLNSCRSSLICCGTSLIKIREQEDNLIQKLEDNQKFKIKIYLFSPSNRTALIKDYEGSTQEEQFLNHLRITYTTFLRLSYNYPGRVDLYLYHTLPFFSCVVFDQGKKNESMIVRQYINGKYPPDCPAIELDSNSEIDKRIIKEHMEGIIFLEDKSNKLQINVDASKYWDGRSKALENISWVINEELIDKIISMSDIQKENEILEIGSGTGILAKKIDNRFGSFIGVDISKEMVCISNDKKIHNAFFMYSDAKDLRYFSEPRFDIVFARMVLHHMTDDLTKCLSETYRVLKKGGKFIVCENMPITKDKAVVDFHKKCLEIKEDRITFSPEDLIKSIRLVGYKIDDKKDIKDHTTEISLDNWLRNNNLDEQCEQEIKKLFDSMSDELRNSLKCSRIGHDWLFYTKFLIIRATKG